MWLFVSNVTFFLFVLLLVKYLVVLIMSWSILALQQSRGCFGCAQPTPIIAVDEPTKGLRIQGRSVKRRNLSDDFWSSSPHEMENSALQSRHSMSSISTAAQPNDQHASGSSSSPNEFVNQGKLVNISTSPEQMVLMSIYGALIYNVWLFVPYSHEFETNICFWSSVHAYLNCISVWCVCAPENPAKWQFYKMPCDGCPMQIIT